ncbi:MAG: hypothetical protein D3916_08100 [Candidatus Electrothrix sp. MAN1_4]|nr:hypothetical protein [Candidatus Electrothrix sp. MAN1_4]
MSLLNSDLTKEGYNHGIKHAEEGKAKDYTDMASSAKTWLHGNKAMDSYAKAYDTGYDHGLAKKHDVYSPSSSNATSGESMTSGQNIHTLADADAIEDFQAALAQFNRDLMEKTVDLKNFIQSMQQHSWDDENYLEFKQLFSRITHRVEGIEGSVIEQSMLPTLQAHIETIRQAQMKG